MAKKRGVMSPLGNAVGAEEAQKNAAKANIQSLKRQITTEIEKVGEDVTLSLQNLFGLESVGKSFLWQLASGATATFSEATLSYEQVRDSTYVTFDVNGRDQALLNADSLQDLDSLAFQQFYPAVAREVNGKLDVLDGSRRRAWFLLQNGEVDIFRILVTKDDISLSDAKALAKQLQTAKEHNLREIGQQCLSLEKANPKITQAEVAAQLGMSQAGVSKALKAAKVDERLVKLFPVANDLSHTDYALLNKVMEVYEFEDELLSLINDLTEKVVIIQAEYSREERKSAITKVIKAELQIAKDMKNKAQVSVTNLATFDSSGIYARKRIKGRNFSYEFGRLSLDIQQQLDAAVADVLKKNKFNTTSDF